MTRTLLATIAAALAATALTASPALAATANDQTQFSVTPGTLVFATAPDIPTLTGVTLTGASQTTNTTMANFGVTDATGAAAGWNVTVNGDASGGKSAVFKQYCPNATCGTDSGPGYVAGGQTLSVDSLKLDSTGASLTGGGGSAPTLQCNPTACNVDHATAVKIVSAASGGAGMGTWNTTGFGSSSLALTTPSTLRALQANEYYRLDLLWTLSSGP